MPPKKGPKAIKDSVASAKGKDHGGESDFLEDDYDIENSQHSEESYTKGKKRSHPVDNDDDEEVAGEMQKMFECFGADISKTLSTKRKRLEQYTQNSLKISNRKVEDIWRCQQKERTNLTDEFHKQIGNVFSQWDSDLAKAKEQEDKLMNLFQQQQKLFQQARVVQTQRLKTIRQLHEQFMKGITGLERSHASQQTSVHTELKKEMALLQKKILMDTQQQEMASVRKSLQSMLF